MASPKRTTKRLGFGARATARRLFARAKQMLTTEPGDAKSNAGDETAAQQMALAGAELGGGVAKIAQLLGYRAAPTTKNARAALASLWDNAPPMSVDAANALISDELGKPPDELFSSWSPTPFAAASIGQVHRASGATGDYALERKLWQALLHHDRLEGADRFRRVLLELGLISSARAFHSELCREWERLVIAPFERKNFLWTDEYATDLTTYTAGMIRSGKLLLPAPLVLLWRQRLGVASVLGMLRPTATFRDLLAEMVA